MRVASGDDICRECASSGRMTIVVNEHRCHERNGIGERCSVVGEHPVITNSKGKLAIAHETKTSIWSVPIMDTLSRPLEAP